MQLLVYGILCALGAVAFASLGSHARSRLVLLGIGFVAATGLLGGDRLPGGAAVGTAIAVGALAAVIRPRWSAGFVVLGGAFGGLWSVVLEAQGLPLAPALALGLLCPLVTAVCASRRPEFAPPDLREEALVLVALLGLCTAAAKPIVTGWRSAAALKAVPLADANGAGAGPVLLFAAALLLTGGIFSLWKRR